MCIQSSKAMAPKLPIKQVILKKAAAPKPKASGVPEPAFPPASSSARPTSRVDASEKISSGVKGPNPLTKAYHHKKPSDPADAVSLIDCDTLVLGRAGESQDLSDDEKMVLPYIGVYHGHGLWNRRPMWKSAELGGDNIGLAPEGTCFLWYCQLYDVYCLSSSPHSDKSLSEPSFDWSTTRTLAWCSSDLKSFWCPWNAEAASSVLGWRTCYVFVCDKLVDYSRLFTELQQLKGQAREAQEANEAQEAEAQEAEAKETKRGARGGKGECWSWLLLGFHQSPPCTSLARQLSPTTCTSSTTQCTHYWMYSQSRLPSPQTTFEDRQ